jgi:hypothetical protein
MIFPSSLISFWGSLLPIEVIDFWRELMENEVEEDREWRELDRDEIEWSIELSFWFISLYCSSSILFIWAELPNECAKLFFSRF